MNSFINAKILVIGDSLSGKTSLINRYTTDTFEESPTLNFGIDFKILRYNYRLQAYNIHLWDTAGLEKYRCITKSYFNSANAILLLVDVTDPFSLFKLDRWILSIEESGPSEKVCKVVLVLTKTELEKQIDMVIFKEIAKKYNLDYYEVSSKTGKNIKEMFDKVIWEALALKNKSYFEKISESLKSLDDYHLKSTKESLETCSFSEGISLSSCNNIARDVRKKKGDNNDCSC